MHGWFSFDKGMNYRGWSTKKRIAYLLTAFLEPDRGYSEDEINAFIKSNTKATLRSDSRLDIDHLRVGMLENGFLEREPDGSEYRVAADYSHPWNWMQDAMQDPTREYRFPICGVMHRGTHVLNHMHKYHNHDIDEIIERGLGT